MIRLRMNRPPDAADDGALWWATRRQMDPVRFAEDSRFRIWLEDPQNAAAWEEYDRRLDAVGAFAALPEIRDMRAEALAMVRRPDRPVVRYWTAGGGLLAASLVFGLLWIRPQGSLQHSPGSIATAVPAPAQRYTTGVGEHRDVVLADGSTIALNTSSAVEVQYTPDKRDIRLVTGQAFFRVAHNVARPFVVAAGNRTITATGTAFDVEVKASGQVSVLLVEGHVHVDPVKPTGLARLIPSLEREDLDPGQRFTSAPTTAPVIAVADVERGTAWNRGVLIFRKDRLADAIGEVNRYSTRQLVVEDFSINDLSISGVFPTTNEQDFVAAITTFYPIEAEKKATGTIALRWRNDARPQSN
jgi:transmembrane sensor